MAAALCLQLQTPQASLAKPTFPGPPAIGSTIFRSPSSTPKIGVYRSSSAPNVVLIPNPGSAGLRSPDRGSPKGVCHAPLRRSPEPPVKITFDPNADYLFEDLGFDESN